jgi:hypothetical protein
MINEYEQLRYSAVNDGFIAGTKTSIPIMTRFAVYGVVGDMIARGILSVFTDDDEEFEDVVPTPYEFGRSFLSAFVALTIQRNMSNYARVPMNTALELLNEYFGEGVVREEGEDYNKFANSVVYNKIDLANIAGMKASDMASVVFPPLSPMISSGEAAYKALDAKRKNYDKFFKSDQLKDIQEYQSWKATLTLLSALNVFPRDVRDGYVYYKQRDLIMNRGKK